MYLILRSSKQRNMPLSHDSNFSTTCCSQGTWSDDVSAWTDCEDLSSCPTKLAILKLWIIYSLVNSFGLWLINRHLIY